MTVRELMEALSKLPPEAEVGALYDGFCQIELDCAWLSRSGGVIITNGEEHVTYTDDRPEGAPTTEEERWWSFRPKPKNASIGIEAVVNSPLPTISDIKSFDETYPGIRIRHKGRTRR